MIKYYKFMIFIGICFCTYFAYRILFVHFPEGRMDGVALCIIGILPAIRIISDNSFEIKKNRKK